MSTEAPVAPVAAPVTPAAQFSEWRKSDGTINHEAFKALPEDIRYVGESLSKYKTDVDLFRGIAHLQTLGGKKGLIPLPDNAPKEVQAERKALLDSINGVPKEAKDYGIAKPANLDDKYWMPELADGFTNWAHKWSVSPAAVKEIVGMQMGTVQKQLDTQAQHEQQFWDNEQKTFDNQLRTEGVQSDRAQALVERGAIKLGLDMKDPQTQTFLKGANARLMAMRHAIATGEDSSVKANTSNAGEADPEQMASDAVHNKANPLYEPLYNASHPQHKMAKEKVDGLWRLAAEMKARKAGAR